MSNLGYINDESSFLYNTVHICKELKTGHDGAWQVAPFQCSIPYRSDCLKNLVELKERLRSEFPELIAYGERRAVKAFYSAKDSITKPSYINRIKNFVSGGLDQIRNMEQIFERQPNSGGLVFSVFSPQDLIDRRRPGYVPCLISGTFLVHEGELQINAFFRSQSVIEFGIFDLIFLRELQLEMQKKFNLKGTRSVYVGSLNLHFARILVHRRFLKRNRSFIRRDQIIEKWLSVIEAFRLEKGLLLIE